MNSKKLYYILVGSIALLVIALIGGAYAADSLLTKQADELLAVRSKSDALEVKQQQLTKAKSDITKYRSLANIARSIVPQDKDQAQTVREIVKLADENGIKLGSITFPSSTLGAAVAPPVKPVEGDTTVAPKPPALPQSQLKIVPTIPGVFDLAITVQSDSTSPAGYSQFIDFLADLENNRRTAIVSGINLTPDAKDPSRISFTLDINEYITP